jgi:predicted Zn-dependent protease with MMP-like domain
MSGMSSPAPERGSLDYSPAVCVDSSCGSYLDDIEFNADQITDLMTQKGIPPEEIAQYQIRFVDGYNENNDANCTGEHFYPDKRIHIYLPAILNACNEVPTPIVDTFASWQASATMVHEVGHAVDFSERKLKHYGKLFPWTVSMVGFEATYWVLRTTDGNEVINTSLAVLTSFAIVAALATHRRIKIAEDHEQAEEYARGFTLDNFHLADLAGMNTILQIK